MIPTPSLEKTLLVGDFLLVSKFHYGARIPNTPIALPMVHDTIPLLKIKSYLNLLELPYMRFPGIQKVKRNDIVTFNWPADTVRFFFDKSKIHKYKPVDKKSNYVKRAVGIPGDTLEVRRGYVYINGKQLQLPKTARLQFSYFVKTRPGTNLTKNYMYKRYGVTAPFGMIGQHIYNFTALTDEIVKKLKNNPKILNVVKYSRTDNAFNSSVFPHSAQMPWSVDEYGPIVIPSKGVSVPINVELIPLYKRIITEYEGNTMRVEGTEVFINNKKVNTYTFKQDYYWMMGDNRHSSEDSRYWGFVPEDHILGKPIFIWMSLDWFDDIKIRWDRIFTTMGGEEVLPYWKETEVAKVSFAIPKAISERGGDIRIFTPRFGNINQRRHQIHEVVRLSRVNLVVNDTDMPLMVKVASIPNERMQVYFIDNEDCFNRKEKYTTDKGKLFKDNDERLIFFIKGVIETVKKLNWRPDIIHLHGWITYLFPLYLKTFYKGDPLIVKSKIVTSIYPPEFEGSVDANIVKKLEYDGIPKKELSHLIKATDYTSFLKMAIDYSDGVLLASEGVPKDVVDHIDKIGKPSLNNIGREVDSVIDYYQDVILD
ncbi:signal peptidase I [Elysia marginata]|uniref:Mitochondrial inner membrane protease subunit n=1 Tax=Elysia marginata TaxID=1093978 RepID=A0AAV4GTP7_9GAST|nr:signal peptidase I [Elysia marginata]